MSFYQKMKKTLKMAKKQGEKMMKYLFKSLMKSLSGKISRENKDVIALILLSEFKDFLGEEDLIVIMGEVKNEHLFKVAAGYLKRVRPGIKTLLRLTERKKTRKFAIGELKKINYSGYEWWGLWEVATKSGNYYSRNTAAWILLSYYDLSQNDLKAIMTGRYSFGILAYAGRLYILKGPLKRLKDVMTRLFRPRSSNNRERVYFEALSQMI